jgi:hypothetical protein
MNDNKRQKLEEIKKTGSQVNHFYLPLMNISLYPEENFFTRLNE